MLLEIGGAVWLQTVLSLIRDMLFHLEIFEYLGEAETTNTCNSSRSKFLHLGTVDVLDQIIYYCIVCPMHCRLFSICQ